MKLQIKPLSPKIGREIPLPYYATQGAAALDLHACIDAPVTIPGGGRALIPTGIAVAIMENHVGIVAVRSSMGIRNGVTLSNGVGVIDSDYRGPLGVGLHNLNKEPYTVQPGDTLWLISQRYGTTVEALKRLNGLTGDMLYIGQILKIPVTETGGYREYTVQAGDSLWLLARRFQTTVEAIMKLNGLTSDLIDVGQVVRIPYEA